MSATVDILNAQNTREKGKVGGRTACVWSDSSVQMAKRKWTIYAAGLCDVGRQRWWRRRVEQQQQSWEAAEGGNNNDNRRWWSGREWRSGVCRLPKRLCSLARALEVSPALSLSVRWHNNNNHNIGNVTFIRSTLQVHDMSPASQEQAIPLSNTTLERSPESVFGEHTADSPHRVGCRRIFEWNKAALVGEWLREQAGIKRERERDTRKVIPKISVGGDKVAQ